MMTLSLAMIVRNEERVIERALAGAKAVCDEMIVVDTGSTDRTVERAQHMGATVRHFTWIDDFSAARNFSFESCTGDWILLLDADDVLPPQTQKAILDYKRNGISKDIDIISMTYNYRYDEQDRCTESQFMPRLIRNIPQHRWLNPVHEQLQYDHARTIFLPDVIVEHRQEQKPERLERTKRILLGAISKDNSPVHLLLCHALQLYEEQRWGDAALYFESYLEKTTADSNVYSAMIWRALCALELGDTETMIEWAHRAKPLAANRSEALVLIGYYFVLGQQWDPAIAYLEHAIEFSRPNDILAIDSYYTWLPLDYLSVCYLHKGDVPRAIEYGRRALAFGVDAERMAKNIELMESALAS